MSFPRSKTLMAFHQLESKMHNYSNHTQYSSVLQMTLNQKDNLNFYFLKTFYFSVENCIQPTINTCVRNQPKESDECCHLKSIGMFQTEYAIQISHMGITSAIVQSIGDKINSNLHFYIWSCFFKNYFTYLEDVIKWQQWRSDFKPLKFMGFIIESKIYPYFL